MCGICGTYIANKINKINFLDTKKLLIEINKINTSNFLKKIVSVERQIEKYKSDVNFLNFFYNKNERVRISKIIRALKSLNKKRIFNRNEKLKDIIFVLEIELSNRYKFVKKYLNKKYSTNHFYVIFLKVLSSLINSINYLEMRGRDSLGLCLQLKIKKKNLINPKQIIDQGYNIYSDKDYYIITFVFKTHNPIGILRQNSDEILKQIFNNSIIIDLLNINFELISIYFHTRWASVGKINIDNTHPIADLNYDLNKDKISFSAVNGDVYNYKDIIKKRKNTKKNINTKCTSDSLGLSLITADINENKSYKYNKNLIQTLKGSYCSCSVSDNYPGEILLIKNGQQGLYLGKSQDRYYFASDVYGLVEESSKFFKIDNDCFIFLPSNIKSNLFSYNLNNKKNYKKIVNNFLKIEVNLRDIFLGSNPHYFFKEINESPNIIKKTNEKYFFSKKNYDENKKINFLKKAINQKKINKIIITGMGTCYTAAVAISHYMRDIITKFTNLELIIQPHMASEGSGFYTDKDMRDHLVIILGQSGTTVDTNTYAKMAKERGAFTVSFLNKRQGDLSYLVDLNLYIGDGRDVEISVPSTKTYLAHICLGYIFTLKIIENKNNTKRIYEEKNKLLNLPNIIKREISHTKKINFKDLFYRFCVNPKWYIVYDESNLSVTNLEIKIKLSELCYQSIPTYDIKYFIDLDIRNSILIINSSKNYINLEKDINTFLHNRNIIILLSTDIRFDLIKNNNFYFFYQKNSLYNYELFSSIIFFQYFAYKLANKLNERYKLLDLFLNIKLNKKDKYKKYIQKELTEGFFNQGGFKNKIYKFIKLYNTKKNNKKFFNEFILLSKLLMRPIDTVKHQAKTITVGATRDTYLENKKLYSLRKRKKNKYLNNYFLYSNLIHESYVYDLVNKLSKLNTLKNINFNLARSYDLNKISNKQLNFINIDNMISEDHKKNTLNVNEYNKLFLKIANKFSKIKFKQKNIDFKKILNLKNIFGKLQSNILKSNNIKFLGSGVNYNAAKLLSLMLTQIYKKPIAFEVLENHKHIDVSAEPFLIILLGNIKSNLYHFDAFSEIIKFSSHNNKSMIFVDEKNIEYYEKLPRDMTKIKHQIVNEEDSFSFYLSLFAKIFKISQ